MGVIKFVKVVSMNLIAILIMSAKLTAPGLLKFAVFWNKGYDIMIKVCDVNNKIFSRDLNYIVSMIMWPQFGNPSISMKEVVRKPDFWGVVLGHI